MVAYNFLHFCAICGSATEWVAYHLIRDKSHESLRVSDRLVYFRVTVHNMEPWDGLANVFQPIEKGYRGD